MNKNIEFEESSGNVFEDLGFENPEQELLVSKLTPYVIALGSEINRDDESGEVIVDIEGGVTIGVVKDAIGYTARSYKLKTTLGVTKSVVHKEIWSTNFDNIMKEILGK